jgi:hypothetical protein
MATESFKAIEARALRLSSADSEVELTTLYLVAGQLPARRFATQAFEGKPVSTNQPQAWHALCVEFLPTAEGALMTPDHLLAAISVPARASAYTQQTWSHWIAAFEL